MNAEDWRTLVQRLEPEARTDREAYTRKVALLGALGYAVIALSLVLLAVLAALVISIAVTGSAVFAKLLIPIVGLGYVIARSLAVKIEPPEGIELDRVDAPELFAMIDHVNARVEGPRVHTVLIDGNPNAAVVQIPRRGFVFGQRNYLVLGLPYMQAMTPEELSAVVAHELGHLSRNHGRFGVWVYRVQATWWQLLAGLERRRSFGTGLFRRFFEWYVPRFDAYSFPLRREHEFEADEAAAAAVGALPVATSLLTGTVAARHLGERYWPRLYERAADEHEPPRSPFSAIAAEVASAHGRTEAPRWIESELRREPSPDDTHPSTLQRIRHLGLSGDEVVAAASRPRTTSAADAFLGLVAQMLAAELDERWRTSIGDAWRERHREAQEGLARLRELEVRRADGTASLDDLQTLASLTEDLRGADAALPFFNEVLARNAEDPAANFVVGRVLLERGDEAGLEHLQRAIEADARAAIAGCELAIDFLLQQGREQEAARFRSLAQEHLALIEAADEERSNVTLDDEFEPHDLSPELVTHVRSVAVRDDEVGRVYVVRRRTKHLDREFPFYFIAVTPKSQWRTIWRESANDDKPSLADRLAQGLEELPVQFQLVVLGPRAGQVEERFRSYPDALVYDREAS